MNSYIASAFCIIYHAFMTDTPNDRLRRARAAAGHATAIAAADALGVPRSTYIGHENGHRGFPAKRATQYASGFGTSPEWLLYGTSAATGAPAPLLPSVEVLREMLREAIQDEVTLATKLADLPHIVAPSLHAQLARYAADPGLRGSEAGARVRGTVARSRAPTKAGARAGSRSA
jgi:hypothetical protein